MTGTAKPNIGRIGIWAMELRFADPAEIAEAAAELEALGYGALWIPGGIDGDVLAAMDRLLDATSRIAVCSGIVNIWNQPPAEVGAWWQGQPTERQARILLGLGVSHGPAIGERYGRPLGVMGEYLDGLAPFDLPKSALCLAALGPKMLELARDRTAGAHPYLVPPEHSAIAREILGPDALLAPEMGVVFETDPARAREIARQALEPYRGLPNYTNSWRRLGLAEEDIATASDRLIDALFAWGDAPAIAARVNAHLAAGADHVCLQVVTGPFGGEMKMPCEAWRALAAELV